MTSAAAQRTGRLRWVEPWYSAYALVGLVLLGVAPILLPLSVESKGAGAVGVVVASFYIGALFTPVFGAYADRTGRQRTILLACFPIMAGSMVLFAFADATWQWAPLALLFGGAGAVAGTVAGMFVVEAHPPQEWNDRISWFRLGYGAGQVVGLVIAAYAAAHLRFGWLLAAALVALGLWLGRLGLPTLAARSTPPSQRAPALPPSASVRQIHGVGWILHAYHRPDLGAFLGALRSRFGVFILAWVLTMIGVQTFFNVVPLVMRDAFDVSPSTSSVGFMVGAVLGTLVFPLLGRLATAAGPGKVLALGLLLSLLSFGGMALLVVLEPAWRGPASLVLLVAATIAYSFEVVSATMLTAGLTPFSQGSAMGVLNSAIAAGAIIGALVPAAVAASLGYSALPAMAAGVLVVALLAVLPLLSVRAKA